METQSLKNETTEITCGIYLFNKLNNKILICHATNTSWATWTIPKGLKQPGEDCYQAAIRELNEETGIKKDDFKILNITPFPRIKYRTRKKILESFLIITDSEIINFPFRCMTLVNEGFPEIDSWKWTSLESANKSLHESQRKNLNLIKELVEEIR